MVYKNPVPSLDEKIDILSTDEYEDYVRENEMYFVFVDILGFKKTFEDYRLSNDFKSVEKYKEVFNYYFALMDNAKFMGRSDSDCYAGQTSDSLYFYTNRQDYLISFIKIFVHFNLYAMSKNVFFRGGISKGMLFKKQDYQFFGDSVIGAYLMESNISKNPIITVDERTYNDLIEYDPGFKDWFEPDGGRHYIKVFNYSDDIDVSEDFVKLDFDKNDIKENIEANIRYFEYDVHNHSKYIFLKRKMNNVGQENLNE